jgi:hypothetical protein
MLAAGARVSVTVTLFPTAAAILAATAVAVIEGGELLLPVRMAARAKYQFVGLSSRVADLGAVLRGGGGGAAGAPIDAAMRKTIRVTNQSAVRATLHVTPAGGSSPAYFSIVPPGGVVIPAGGTMDLTAALSAEAPAGARPCERFTVAVPGGNSITLTCCAAVGGPVVSAARKDRVGAPPAKRPLTVQFGDLEVGSRSTHVITLSNSSRAPADFQWACGGAGAFLLSEVSGVLPAQLSKPVVVTFAPAVPGNFYRRLVCLVRDGDPVWVDVMGTAFSSAQVGGWLGA